MRLDETFPGLEEARRRFRRVMDVIDEFIGRRITDTVYSSKVYFFSIFVYLYDAMYGLGSELKATRAKKLDPSVKDCFLRVSEDFQSQSVPPEVLDAVQRASSDLGRRRTRLQYLKSQCDG